MDLTALEKKLINGWQKDFPLSPRPYAEIAAALGVSEDAVMTLLEQLKQKGMLSRVGAVVRPNSVGASSLVAMKIPPEELADVAEIVCNEPQVNHNYERENDLNLWFVVTASDAQDLDNVLARIEKASGYKTVKLPLKKAYHIDLGFCI